MRRSNAGPSEKALAPTEEEAFHAFCTLLRFCSTHAVEPQTYDQRPDRLPPDAKSADAYKRWHRAARRSGRAGVWTRGKLLVATREAWITAVETRRTDAQGTPRAMDDDAELDAALGILAARAS